ncbi:MAG: 4Fe-4S dicluster domain-containing protein, partial [Candidatus Thermoplasmatota archaeon]|nr:4Fe-4S dicluster domain-containing protein [Candidatus Thermoplasmatota archaeon]
MTEEESEMDFPIDIHADDCGECRICPAACPYEAIEIDTERNVAVLDQEKCMICGICAPACPINAIDTYYYDKDALRGYLESKMTDGADTLVIYCRGSAPSDEELVEMVGVKEFIPMAIPCIGRMPLD